MNNQNFAFKELKVWQKAIQFTDEVIDQSENINSNTKHFRLVEQLESAAASVPQNIAEGKGRTQIKSSYIFFI